MRSSLLTLVLLLLGVLESSTKTTAVAFQAIGKVTVDLSPAVTNRTQLWTPLLQQVVGQHGWNNTLGPFLSTWAALMERLPKGAMATFEQVLKQKWPMYYDEVQGVYDTVVAMGYGDLFDRSVYMALPFSYEIAHVQGVFDATQQATKGQGKDTHSSFPRSCTAILSLPGDKSQPILHGRNYDMSPGSNRNMTLDITFTYNGGYVYSSIEYTWMTATFWTANRVGRNTTHHGSASTGRLAIDEGLTLEENFRNDGDLLTWAQLKAKMQQATFVPVGFLFRAIMEHHLPGLSMSSPPPPLRSSANWLTVSSSSSPSVGMSFDEASRYLASEAMLGAPAYVIMSGTERRGTILTLAMDPANTVQVWLNDTSNVTFMVQTNYDRWLPDPVYDDRRTVAHDALVAVGREESGTRLGVWMALSTYPVHNPSTIFSALMSVSTEAEGYIRVPMLPVSGPPQQP